MMTLLYSGNIGIGQDLGTVLRAVAQLKGNVDIAVRIVGGGKALPELKKLAAELALGNVEFSSPIPLYQLPDLLADGDIHVICQQPGTEGLLVPSKIYSTLAAGRPSLFIGLTNCEVGQILRDSGSGFVIKPGDVECATNTLIKLATSPQLRQNMGEKARRYYERHFGRDKSIQKIVDILESVNSAGRGTGIQ